MYCLTRCQTEVMIISCHHTSHIDTTFCFASSTGCKFPITRIQQQLCTNTNTTLQDCITCLQPVTLLSDSHSSHCVVVYNNPVAIVNSELIILLCTIQSLFKLSQHGYIHQPLLLFTYAAGKVELVQAECDLMSIQKKMRFPQNLPALSDCWSRLEGINRGLFMGDNELN